jgi:hypothetical protein
VRDCEFENKYLRFFLLFSEVKIISFKVTFVPSTIIRNTSMALGSLFASVRHEDYTSFQSIGDSIIQAPNISVHSMASPGPITKVWHYTKGDAEEDNFYNAGGTSIGRIIPASLGGIAFWCDGPVAQVGSYIGDFLVEWHLMYRGMRND